MHYETLSLFQHPTAYLAWLLERASLVVAIIVGYKFYRATQRILWLILLGGFVLLLAYTVINSLRLGLPLLPYAEVSAPIEGPPATNGLLSGTTVFSRSFVHWNATTYLLAISLYLAWRQYRTR